MKTLDQLFTEIEQLSQEQRALAFSTYTMQAATACMDYATDSMEAVSMLGVLICAALIADDKISSEEFEVLSVSMKLAFGEQADMEKCRQMAETMLRDGVIYRQAAEDLATNYLSHWDKEDVESVILCCLSICAIDGEISIKEREWLKTLVAAL